MWYSMQSCGTRGRGELLAAGSADLAEGLGSPAGETVSPQAEGVHALSPARAQDGGLEGISQGPIF